jgi:uncharacterized protein (TIGR00297 family)
LLTLVLGVAYLFIVVFFALFAFIQKVIDGRGLLASMMVGFAVIYGGGITWFVIVAVFFILGVVFTLYKYGYKKKLGSAQGKRGERSWPNILANGGLASVFSVGEFLRQDPAFEALFLGAVAAAAADTVATELGLLNKTQPRLITRPSMAVSPGTSGGVSLCGYLGAFVASMAIGVMALVLRVMGTSPLVIAFCVTAGMGGATVDSVIGATVQRKGICKVCQKQTEELTHCGERTKMTGGIAFVENNFVNVIATLAGAIFFLTIATLA